MDEYIERETAIKAIDNEVSLDGLYANIKAIPAADVQTVRHEVWFEYETKAFTGKYDKVGNAIFVDKKYFRCSNCDQGSIYKSNYCPNCGAKMD